MEIRPAALSDLEDIMELESVTFGPIGTDAMASRDIMARRIKRCNGGRGRWFWIAKDHRRIVGDMILQPTNITPEQCTSWGVATDNGTMNRTFNEKGKNIYVVSFAVRQDASFAAPELLIHVAFVQWLASRKKDFMFCSRMPGFAAAQKKYNVEPEVYWQLTHKDGGPRDPMLRYCWNMTGGAKPFSLLKNGFLPDKDSGGHSVLFILHDPFIALLAVAHRICALDKKPEQKEGNR